MTQKLMRGLRKLARACRARLGMWRHSRQLPNHSPRLMLLRTLPDRLARCGCARKCIGGLCLTDRGQTMEITFPTGDVIHSADKSPAAIEQAIRVYCNVAYLGSYMLLHQPKPGDVVIDLGANVGSFAMAAAKLVGETGRVYCCEPVPENARALQRTADSNHLGNIVVIPKAVGDEVGSLELHRGRHPGEPSALLHPEGEVIPVEVTTVDTLVAEHNLTRLDFMKIDVEGYEPQVLAGARETIARFRPIIVIAGYHQKDDTQRLPQLLRDLASDYICRGHDEAAWESFVLSCHCP